MSVLNLRRRTDSIQRDQRAQLESTALIADGVQAIHLFYVYQPLRRGDLVFHQGKQVTAAGQYLYLAPALAEQGRYLVCLGWAGVIKRSHGCLLLVRPTRGRA